MTVWRVRVDDGRGAPQHVLVDGEPSATVADLAAALQAQGFQGGAVNLDGRALSPLQRLEEVRLVHGASVGLGVPADREALGPGQYLVVVAGPDTGRWTILRPGAGVVVGRSAGCDLALSDSLLSGRHLRVHYASSGALTAEDLQSTNGTLMEGEPLEGSRALQRGEYLQVGTSILTVCEVAEGDRAPDRLADGSSMPFQRHFREASEPLTASLRAPRAPTEATSSLGTSWLRSMAPLLGGLAFAVISGRWIFLLVVAISPLIFIVDNLRRRRATERETAADKARYDEALDQLEARHRELKQTELLRLRAQANPGGLAGLFGLVRHRRIWERSSQDDDFGAVTVGLAPGESRVAIEGDLPEGRALSSRLWCSPLVHSLVSDGPLSIVGPVPRARATARSMVLELCSAHSPADVKLWLLTSEDDAKEWEAVRWLPHAFSDEYSVRVAGSAQGRAAFMSELQRLVTNRASRAGAQDRRVLPIHVVVVDGTDLVAPEDLTEILANGPAVGVTGITVDRRGVPEGTTGRIGVGAYADVASFSSRRQPATTDVITFEISAAQAEATARGLAGLRPVSGPALSAVSGSTRLRDLLNADDLDARGLAARWNRATPTTATLVGIDAGVPVVVDLAKDGPHGLVGGTTRSGKTEFLKTLVTGLALANHPDDLSIAIIDFKGGVDHELAAGFPHTVNLSTNADIGLFVRTTALLNAELRRRQSRFREAGAANLEAYRAARSRTPALEPIPALLVIVDEFSELLATDEGKASLAGLESITRVGGGLGVHLLLVTQNFENQLPPQIAANAGLRVCFRVQHPSHSKIVLDDDSAASIPPSAAGRAFLRSHGGDLREFQTARVAGARPGCARLARSLTTAIVPFGAASAATPASVFSDVPAEETDMYDLVALCRGAAHHAGWSTPAIPWPPVLPSTVALEKVLAPAGHGEWIVGLADHPDEQAHRPLTLSRHNEVLLLLGGPDAGLAEGMRVISTGRALIEGPDVLHLYVIDQLGQGLAALAHLPHTGAVATRNDPLARRILEHLSQEVSRRRSLLLESAASSFDDLGQRGTPVPPHLLLLVHGCDRLLLYGEGASSPLLAPLLALTAEVGGVGVQIVLSGSPTIAHHRLGSNATRRLVFELTDPQEYSVLGVPAPARSTLRGPGRGYDSATARTFQMARLADPGVAGADRLLDCLGQELRSVLPAVDDRGPEAIRDVGWPLPWKQLPALAPPPELVLPLANAVDVEDGDLVWLDADEDGPVIAVTGSSRSGRSTALLATGRIARELGHRVVGVSLSRRSPLHDAAGQDIDEIVTPAYLGSIRPGSARPLLVLIDDLQRWSGDTELLEKLLASDQRVAIFASGPADFFGSRNEVTRCLGIIRTALVLAPTSASEASNFGLRRIDDDVINDRRPGRGILVLAGDSRKVQVPLP